MHMTNKLFSIREAVKTGWQKTLANGWFLGFTLIAIWFVSYVMNAFWPERSRSGAALAGLISLLGWILIVLLEIGFVRAVLKVLDGHKPSMNDFTATSFTQFVYFALASILTAIAVGIGFFVFVIPGIIFAVRLQFYPYLIVEHGLGPIAAMKRSWAISRGQTWNLFVFGLVLMFISFVGAILFGVGLLIAVPTVTIAAASVYRKLAAAPAAPVSSVGI